MRKARRHCLEMDMSLSIGKERKLGVIVKTWRRIYRWRKPMNGSGCSLPPLSALGRSMSWHPLTANSDEELWGYEKLSSTALTPHGHLAVYVGEDRQRFVIKTKYINHPLFRKLLDEAEKEYGFHSEGPLVLPCQVGVFHRILWIIASDYHNNYKSPAKNYIKCVSA